LFDDLQLNALCLFDKNNPATLSKKEVSAFDEKINNILLKLPSSDIYHEDARKKELEENDLPNEKFNKKSEDEENEYGKELRRSFKTVEVMGKIIKNRSGFYRKNSFFSIISNSNSEDTLINFISEKIDKQNPNVDKKISEKDRKELVKKAFWQLNFLVAYAHIERLLILWILKIYTKSAMPYMKKLKVQRLF
jgi:hypothetical protein